MRGTEITGAVGVQLAAGEPQLERASAAELTARFGGADRAELNVDGAAFLRSLRQSGASQPMATLLLLLALLAVLAEAWISGRYRTRMAATADSLARAD